MCFNKETSIVTFIFGIAASMELFKEGLLENKNGKKVLGIILFLVSLMQLNEYFLWLYVNPKDDTKKPINEELIKKNYIANLFVIIILLVQIVFTWLATYYYGVFDFKGSSSSSTIYYLSIFSTIFTIGALVSFGIGIDTVLKNPITDNLSYKDDKTCRITWGPFLSIYNSNPEVFICMVVFYVLSLLMTFLVNKFLPILIGLVLIISLIYSSAKAEKPIYEKNTETKNIETQERNWNEGSFVTVFGSIWCFLCIVLSVCYAIFGLYDL